MSTATGVTQRKLGWHH